MTHSSSKYVGWMAGLLLVMGAGSAALAAEAQTKRFKVPGQELSAALKQFAVQSNVEILFAPEDAAAKQSQSVEGDYEPMEALKMLLSGTGLKYRITPGRSVVIENPTRVNKNSFNLFPAASAYAAVELARVDLAELAANEKQKSKKEKGSEDVEEMIVEEGRIKAPFSDANTDIPRTTNDVQPYYIFDSETIERSAAMNVEDFLKQRLTMNTTVQTPGQRTLNQSSGDFAGLGNNSAINLRGLGMDKTLVLINGRRIAGASRGSISTSFASSQADLNTIPLSLIDRIEVMPSSSSGIYGGNALGGVINVILKKRYSGGEVRASYDNTWDKDAPSRNVGFSYGLGINDKTQVMLSGQWADAGSLWLQDRRGLLDRGMATIQRNYPAFIYNGLFLGALPNITSSGEFLNNVSIPDPGVLRLRDGTSLGSRNTHISAGTSVNTSSAALNASLLANANSWNLELPQSSQNPTGLYRQFSVTPATQSFMGSISYQLTPAVEVTLDLGHSKNKSLLAQSIASTSLTISSVNPINPFNSAVSITLPSASVAPLQMMTTNDNVTLGFTAKLPRNWTMQGDYTWSRNRWIYAYKSLDNRAFSADVASGTVNPFIDQMRYPINFERYVLSSAYDLFSSISSAAIRGSGPLWNLPWGTPNLTVGLEHRLGATPRNVYEAHYTAEQIPNNHYRTTYFARDQQVTSLYAEMSVPLIKQNAFPLLTSLELQLSGRGERIEMDAGTPSMSTDLITGVSTYSAPTINGQPYFGKATNASTNNTIGFKYQPIPDLIFRASTATAYLPPLPAQLIKNPLPNTSPSTVLDPRNNNAQVRVTTISGGNPDLKPQNSKSRNAGIIWQPSWPALQGLRLNAEYYSIEQFDAIGTLAAQFLLDNESMYPDRVIRTSSGAIALLDLSSVNLYHRETEGWDLSADYEFKTRMGNFSVHAVESLILHLKDQYSLVLPEFDNVDFPSEGGAAKYKSNLQIVWDHRNWSAGWAARYFGSYKQYGVLGGRSATQARNANPNAVLTTTYTAPQGSSTIPSQMYHDLFLSYSFKNIPPARGIAAIGSEILSGITAQAGVKNVFNTLPPVDVFYDYYISPYGDTRLRSYWLSFKKSF